jgi:3-oxoacyl-[acyl-carrier protein] reductase
MIFKDKVAIVTGGARGIGRAITLMLAEEGADVAFTYLRSSEESKSLTEEIRSAGRRALELQIDVRDLAQAKELVEQTKEKLGRLDILVNNAGIIRDKALMMMSNEDWRDVLDTNLGGVFNVTRSAIISFLKEKSGSIVNITSISGVIGMARQTNYSASKAGIIGFTKALAREVAPYNIRVNAVAPGFIETDMISGLKEEQRQALKKNIPLGRIGAVQDVAGAVRFLLDEKSGYITGQVLVVDGGLMLMSV